MERERNSSGNARQGPYRQRRWHRRAGARHLVSYNNAGTSASRRTQQRRSPTPEIRQPPSTVSSIARENRLALERTPSPAPAPVSLPRPDPSREYSTKTPRRLPRLELTSPDKASDSEVRRRIRERRLSIDLDHVHGWEHFVSHMDER
ncbi:hypothetical protein PG997_005660 [Apiospora hydei]|uniref:Uncharacterized protein n=1 Tax=Apiospora hydei TaxID=1337664 RepID=A0ABR1WLL6_9PEZI